MERSGPPSEAAPAQPAPDMGPSDPSSEAAPAQPAPHSSSPSPDRSPWRGIPYAALLALIVLSLLPDVRAWAFRALVLPVVADVLGRTSIVVDGRTIHAGFTRAVQVAFGAAFVLLLVALRANLMDRQARGSEWARRVRLDGAFMLALVPFMALGPVIAALESGLLFTVPWAFSAVQPLLALFIIVTALVSLLFGLWIEDGGAAHARGRYVTALLVFVSFDLFWIAVLRGTTERLVWWATPLALALSFLVFYGVTLGNRLLSHRRALFALGFFHTAFFATFLAQWVVHGPWPAHDWSYRGIDAVRTIVDVDPWNAFLAVLPPIGVATGIYTIGAFLHRYHVLARPFTEGLNMALVFAHLLEAWTLTVLVADPYNALDTAGVAPGPLSSWALGIWNGWGYFALKGSFALIAVLVLDLPIRGRSTILPRETSHLARGALVALGLVPGLRTAIRITTGI